MKIGIIGAMEQEIRLLKQSMTDVKVTTHYGFDFIEGTLCDKKVVLVQSGIGKVNATMSTVLLVQLYHVTAIINTGSAGGLKPQLRVGDVVVANSLMHHDVDVTAFGYVKGQMAQMPIMYESDIHLVNLVQEVCHSLQLNVHIGQIVSGDEFVSQAQRVATIQQEFPEAFACEMESAAIAQTAYVMNVPFVIIRAISDSANDEAAVSFDEFIEVAGQKSAQIVMHLLKGLSTSAEKGDKS